MTKDLKWHTRKYLINVTEANMEKLRKKNIYDIGKTRNKMREVNSPLLIITLNVNGLSSSMKKQGLLE